MQKNKIDVVIIGAGITGCYAATEVMKTGASVILVEQNTVPKRPFRESFVRFDVESNGIFMVGNQTSLESVVYVNDGKLAFEFPYGTSHSPLYTGGDCFHQYLLSKIKKYKIPIVNRSGMEKIIYDNNRCYGVKLCDGTEIKAEHTILCTGIDSLQKIGVPLKTIYSKTPIKYKNKIKINLKLNTSNVNMKEMCQNRGYYFFKKPYEAYLCIPFENYLDIEMHTADVSIEEARNALGEFVNQNRLLKPIINRTQWNLNGIAIEMRSDWSIYAPVIYNGLSAAGSALNLPSILPIDTTYRCIKTCRLLKYLLSKDKIDDVSLYKSEFSKILEEIESELKIINDSEDIYTAILTYANKLIENTNEEYFDLSL